MAYEKRSAMHEWYTEYRDIIIPLILGLGLFAAGMMAGWAIQGMP